MRGRIYEHSSDAGGDLKEDLFEKIEEGFWKLRDAKLSAEFISDRRDLSPDEVVEMVLVREHWRKKPQRSIWKNQAFTVSHADGSAFVGEGLRAFFEYRDLGIKDATQGKFGAHVIRAVPGMESPGAWHSHDLEFQMVYVTKGWVVFEYEGQGEHVLRAGSSVLQPPGIVHREVRHSDDMELIEIISPAAFDTTDEALT
ncbi:MAG: cupin domain-containing protein [Ruegeria sp.]